MTTNFETEILKLQQGLVKVEEAQSRLRMEKEHLKQNIARLTSCSEAEKMVLWLEENPERITCRRYSNFEKSQIIYLLPKCFDDDGNVIEEVLSPFARDGCFYVQANPKMWLLDHWPENEQHPLFYGKPQEVQFITSYLKQSQFSMPPNISARVVALCEKHLSDQ